MRSRERVKRENSTRFLTDLDTGMDAHDKKKAITSCSIPLLTSVTTCLTPETARKRWLQAPPPPSSLCHAARQLFSYWWWWWWCSSWRRRLLSSVMEQRMFVFCCWFCCNDGGGAVAADFLRSCWEERRACAAAAATVSLFSSLLFSCASLLLSLPPSATKHSITKCYSSVCKLSRAFPHSLAAFFNSAGWRLKLPTQEGTAGSRKVGRQVRTLLAGWLVGWVPLRFPACRACFFFETEMRERVCVSLLVSAEVATFRKSSNPRFASLRNRLSFFLPLVLVILSWLCCCCVSLSCCARTIVLSFVAVCVLLCVFGRRGREGPAAPNDGVLEFSLLDSAKKLWKAQCVTPSDCLPTD